MRSIETSYRYGGLIPRVVVVVVVGVVGVVGVSSTTGNRIKLSFKRGKNYISEGNEPWATKLRESCLRGKGGASTQSRGMMSSMTSSKMKKCISQ